MKDKKPISGKAPGATTEANDVLETAELIRANATLLRMSVGVVAFSKNLCAAEVFPDAELDSINKAYDKLFHVFQTLYASLMGRYSALSSSGSIGSPTNVPKSN